MAIAPLQIPTANINSDITPQLSQLTKTINDGQKRQRLSDLGKRVADGTADYRQVAGELASLGDIGSSYKFLEMAEAKDKLARGRAASGSFLYDLGSLTGGIPQQPAATGVPVAAGPTVPNDSNALPGQAGMDLRLADRSQDFIQDHPNTSISSGFRSNADQARLYADRANNPNPVAAPGTSNHERGLAIDIGGMTGDQRAMLPQYGLSQPVANDPPHVELARETQVASNDPAALPVNAQATQGYAVPGQSQAAPSAANGFQGINASHIPALLRARSNLDLPKEDRELADKLLTRALDDAKPSEKVRTLQALKQQSGYQGTLIELEKELKSAGAINIDQRAESGEAKAAGEAAGKRRGEMFAAAGSAGKTLTNLSRMEGLLNQVSQGKIQPARMTISAWAKSMGLNDDVAKSLGLDPNGVGSAQAVQSLINESVVGKIGAGGFPANNFSDADREFITKIFPSLGDDPAANKIRIEGARRMAQLDIERARAFQQFKANPANKGKGFEDFELDWSDKLAKRDVFGDLRKQAESIVGAPRDDIGGTINNPGAAPQRGATGQWGNQQPPVQGARQARDGKFYVPDPNRPGKYLEVR